MSELIDPAGNRLYLTAAERAAFLIAAEKAEREVRSFCEVLHFTGCRISEALALTVSRVDLDGQALVFETLKKRRRGVYGTFRSRRVSSTRWCSSTASGKLVGGRRAVRSGPGAGRRPGGR